MRFLKTVDRRDSDTLIKIIHENTKAGTTVIADKWRRLNIMKRYGYHHLSVNHRYDFVCPNTQIFTLGTFKVTGQK